VDTARGPRPDRPRIPVVTDPGPQVAAFLDRPSGLRAPDGAPINILRTAAHNPVVLEWYAGMGGALSSQTLHDRRSREIVILRVGWDCRSVYEFAQHTRLGREIGLTDEHIAALAGGDLSIFSEDDRVLIALADELCSTDSVTDATWAKLAARFRSDQLIELVMLAGYYQMVSCFLNSVGVALEDGVAGWPPSARP
jgi:alkylhydroperoxidase family enzyme